MIMKDIILMISLLSLCGCTRHPELKNLQPNRELAQLLSRARTVLVGEFTEPMLITNAGVEQKAYYFQTVGTVTNFQEVDNLVKTLAETGTHGDSGVCLCGVLPSQIFVDAIGHPLCDVYVHVLNNNVIILTNLTKLDGRIVILQPMGEITNFHMIATGDNPRYGNLALGISERLWPDELIRREIKAHNKAAEGTARRLADPRR